MYVCMSQGDRLTLLIKTWAMFFNQQLCFRNLPLTKINIIVTYYKNLKLSQILSQHYYPCIIMYQHNS